MSIKVEFLIKSLKDNIKTSAVYLIEGLGTVAGHENKTYFLKEHFLLTNFGTANARPLLPTISHRPGNALFTTKPH